MSYRPTISVYINGKIVDNGYYRNWNDKDLFYEAITIAAFFGDCKSRHEYYERMYGTQKVYHVFEPEAFEATEENLKWFEELSEFPVIVDFTNKCIYASYNGPLFSTNLSKRPTVTNGRKIKCKRRIWKQIRPERGDFFEFITNGGFYDSGYGWLEKTVTGIGATSPDEDFTYILNNSKVSFENIDMAAIRKIILEWDEAKYHLSTTLMKRIKLINSVA